MTAIDHVLVAAVLAALIFWPIGYLACNTIGGHESVDRGEAGP